jgi:exopolysaccharide production protein ExoZ
MRFLAAFGVAAMHVGLINGRQFFPIGIAGVDVFFVISGFIMTIITWDRFGVVGQYQIFTFNRLSRIVPLYWIATIVYFILSILVGFISLRPLTPGVIPQTIFGMLFIPAYMTPFLPPGWSLFCEMLFYLLFSLALLWSRRIAIPALICVLFALAGVGECLNRNLDIATSWGFAYYWLSPLSLEFAWGMIIGIVYARGVRLAIPVAGMACVVGVSVAVFYFEIFPAVQHRELGIGIPAALLLLGAVNLPQVPSNTIAGRLSVFLGDASYALYLTHCILFIFIKGSFFWLLLFLAVTVAIIVRLVIEAPILLVLGRRRSRWTRSVPDASPSMPALNAILPSP